MPIGTVGSDGILRRTDRPDTYRGAASPPAFLSPRFRVGGGNRAADEEAAYRERAEREAAERRKRSPVGRKRSPVVARALAAVAVGAERKRQAAIAARREAEYQAAWRAAVAARSGR